MQFTHTLTHHNKKHDNTNAKSLHFSFHPLLPKKEKEENYSSSPCASSNKAFAPSGRPAKRQNSATRDKASFRSAP